MAVCLCVFVSVLPGPAGASQAAEMRLHAPTHRERGEGCHRSLAGQTISAAICCHTLSLHNSSCELGLGNMA